MAPKKKLVEKNLQGQKRKMNEKEGKKKSKIKKRAKSMGYRRYIYMVMKEVNPGMTISSKAMTILDNFMVDMFERIAETAATLTKYVGRVTLTAAGIRCATKMVFPPGQLAKHAMTEGRKAVIRYI